MATATDRVLTALPPATRERMFIPARASEKPVLDRILNGDVQELVLDGATKQAKEKDKGDTLKRYRSLVKHSQSPNRVVRYVSGATEQGAPAIYLTTVEPEPETEPETDDQSDEDAEQGEQANAA